MIPSNMFTHLTVGATFSRAFSIVYERWELFLAVSAMVYLPSAIYMYTLNDASHEAMKPLLEAIANNEADGAELDFGPLTSGAFITKVLFAHLITTLVDILSQATIALVVAELYVGRTPTLIECMKKAASSFCSIVCAGFVVGLGVFGVSMVMRVIISVCIATGSWIFKFIAFVFAVLFAVAVTYVYVAMMIVAPVIMVEGKSSTNAIQRCWELAAGNRCYIYCTSFALTVIASLFNVIFVTAVGLFIGNPEFQFTLLGTFASVFTFLPVMTLLYATISVVYLKIRIDQEGLNKDVLCRDLGAASHVLYSPLESDPQKENLLMTTV